MRLPHRLHQQVGTLVGMSSTVEQKAVKQQQQVVAADPNTEESGVILGESVLEGDDVRTLTALSSDSNGHIADDRYKKEFDQRGMSVYSMLVALPLTQWMKTNGEANAKSKGVKSTPQARDLIEWTLLDKAEGINIRPNDPSFAEKWEALKEGENYKLPYHWYSDGPVFDKEPTCDTVSVRFPTTKQTHTWADMVNGASEKDGHVLFSIPIRWEHLQVELERDPEVRAYIRECGNNGTAPNLSMLTELAVSHVRLKNVPKSVGVTVGHIVPTDGVGRAVAEINVSPYEMKVKRTDVDPYDTKCGHILENCSGYDKPIPIWRSSSAGVVNVWTSALAFPMAHARKELEEAPCVIARDHDHTEYRDESIVKIKAPIMGTAKGRQEISPLQYAVVRAHPYIVKSTVASQKSGNPVWQLHRRAHMKFANPEKADYLAHKEATSRVLDGISRVTGRNCLVDMRRGLVLNFRMPGGAAAIAVEKLRLMTPTGEKDAHMIPEVSFQLHITGKKPIVDVPVPSIYDTVEGQTVINIAAEREVYEKPCITSDAPVTIEEARRIASESTIFTDASGTMGRPRTLRGRMDR